MKVTFHSVSAEIRGNADEKEAKEVYALLDWLQLDLETFPQKGHMLNFHIGGYSLTATVQYSYVSYCEPDNDLFKKEFWGVNYDVYLEYIEIIEKLS